jgi:hypothetical protein
MSYVINFIVEILLILTYDLGSTDQTMSSSPFYIMWVVGHEVQITTSMSRFPVHFHGQFRTPLHDQNIQEQKGVISFNFHCEFDGRSNAVEMVKKLLQSCWSMWPNHESGNVSEPFRGFVICLYPLLFPEWSINILLTTTDSEFPIAISSFWW